MIELVCTRSLALGLALALGVVPACGNDSSGAAPAGSVSQQLVTGLVPAFELVNAGRFEEARALVDAYEQGPGVVNACQAEFIRGYSHQKAKTYEQAVAHFERAIALEPGYRASHHFLGFAYYYLGDLAGARAAFEAHLALDPDEGDSHFGLGLVAFDEDDLDEAEACFGRALALHEAALATRPDRAREVAKCHARLGDVHQRRDDLAAARTSYERALELWPPHYEVWHKLQRVLTRQGEDQLAAIAEQQYELWKARVEAAAEAPEPEAADS